MIDELEQLEQQQQQDVSRQHSQYSMLQPQFISPPKPVPPRDRYRAPRQYNEPMYDRVEDDDQYGREPPFDSFDERMLHQPVEDRRRQAEQGRARLSLAPKSSHFFTTNAALQARPSYRTRETNAFTAHDHGSSQQQVPRLAHFAYGANQPPETSTDVQLGPSSSPAFKASQRRASAENNRTTTPNQSYKAHPEAEKPRPRAPERGDETSHYQPSHAQRLAPNLPHAPPVVQGIPLVFVSQLPDRLRTVFEFPTFNAVQSKCFDQVYKSDNNFVLASPTGSGKTVIMELAICRAFNTNVTSQYKIVYQAPTKALCSQRVRDWQKKFTPLGLNCVELTGDSDIADLRNVQTANVIITTPEKWDSMTRKWKDHENLMRLIKLFLIDEVHMLKEDRGATLETIVCRMKAIGTDVRFVALSATVPNFDDVAAWLGKNSAEPSVAALKESFGEEFRPVKLQKHVHGYNSNGNDFIFDKMLDSKLPEVITTYTKGSKEKPIMVFCCTRKACKDIAKLLAEWWMSRNERDRCWKAPPQNPHFQDRELRGYAACGVAFHHAGLDLNDRLGVEIGFQKREISVICCTSTLAVGVNLPCHMVIIKNTVCYGNEGLQEYADLEIMQMLGRAGRPQYDTSAVAVIMTRQAKVHRYEMMVTGQQPLESRLHLNLIDHLNAEIVLGTIRDLASARNWIAGTFLHVRLKQNPEYYKFEGARSGQNLDEQLDDICTRGITDLQNTDLVTSEQQFRCTHSGEAMARYYVQFETMKVLANLREKPQISEILSAIAQATELESIRFRQGEKNFYKNINKSPTIRFQIPVNLATPAHKISLMIQAVLGSAGLSWDSDMQMHKVQYNMEMAMVFKHASRLIRCIIDCQISQGDSVGARHALMLDRSLAARAWDDGPHQMKQIEDVGPASIMKFINAGIKNFDDLECTEPHKVERLMGRNPPFGLKILDRVKLFPKLRVSVHVQPNSITRTNDGVKVQLKVEIGFLNEKPPQEFRGKPAYVCILVETSDGRLVHFARISGKKLDRGQDLVVPSLMTKPDQFINCYAMCDGIAGTQREATVKPKIPPAMFPAPTPLEDVDSLHQPRLPRPTSNMSIRRADSTEERRRRSVGTDEFDDDGIDYDELMQATLGDLDFDHIENYANPTDALTRKNTTKNGAAKGKEKGDAKPVEKANEGEDHEPKQLDNGRWECNHKCKNKKICKHMCCRDGLEKPSKKATRRKSGPTDENPTYALLKTMAEKGKKAQTKLQLTASKRKTSAAFEELDMTQQEKNKRSKFALNGSKDYRNLHQLHNNVQKKDPPSTMSSIMHKKPVYQYGSGEGHSLSFMVKEPEKQRPHSSDYGDLEMEELTSHFDRPDSNRAQKKYGWHEESLDFVDAAAMGATSDQPDRFGDDDSVFGEAMGGLNGVQYPRNSNRDDDSDIEALDELFDMDYETNLQDDVTPADLRTAAIEPESDLPLQQFPTSSTVNVPKMQPEKGRSLFFNDTSDSVPEHASFHATESELKEASLEERKQAKGDTPGLAPILKEKTNGKEKEPAAVEEFDENDFLGMTELDDLDDVKPNDKPVPDGFKDLESWLFAEFGDIVELVDG